MKSQDQYHYIVKSNRLIESRYKLSLNQYKIIHLALAQIKKNSEDNNIFFFSVQDVIEVLELKGESAYTELKKTTRELIKKSITIYEDEGDIELQATWVAAAKYYGKKGIIKIEISRLLMPYLVKLISSFTKIEVNNIMSFKSIYACRLFELLKQYFSIGERTVDLDKLRDYFGLEQNEYALYGHLKAKTIDNAITEINTKTDYVVSYEEHKEGRKVTSLTFRIERKHPSESGSFLPSSISQDNNKNITDTLAKPPEQSSVSSESIKNQQDSAIIKAYREKILSLIGLDSYKSWFERLEIEEERDCFIWRVTNPLQEDKLSGLDFSKVREIYPVKIFLKKEF